MVCTSGSVQSAADKTKAAQSQVDKLTNMLKEQNTAKLAEFQSNVTGHLASSNIKDGREIESDMQIKCEYTSEFSLDKVAGVVTSAIKALKAATDPSTPNPATSREALDAYVDVVNTVAEAAKSKAETAASLAFSMNRLGPGVFAFLYASSVNILDEDTFGSEAVTATAIYYKIVESIDDIKQETAFSAAKLNAASYLRILTIQAALLDDLDSGAIDIETYSKKDDLYEKRVAVLEKRLKDAGFPVPKGVQPSALDNIFAEALVVASPVGMSANYRTVHAAIDSLEAKGYQYEAVVSKARARLESGYFQ